MKWTWEAECSPPRMDMQRQSCDEEGAAGAATDKL